MSLLRRYCLRELLTPFLMAIALFSFIFLVGSLVKIADLLVNKGVNILDIIKIFILLIPGLFSFVLPTSALSAVLLVFGSFAQSNEITAMKASGVNVLKVMLPVMVAALLLSVFSLFLNDQLKPRAQFALRSLMNELVMKRPVAYIEAGRFIKDFKGYIIRVQQVKKNRLEGVTIFQIEEDKPTRTIMAEYGEIVASQNENAIGIQLYKGITDEPNPDDPTVVYKLSFDTMLLPAISLVDDPGQKTKKKIKEMTMGEILLTLRGVEHYRQELIEKGMDPGEVERDVRELILRANAEIQKKLSFSVATFCFVLVGLPLAIVTRRGEAFVSFGLSMAVVAIYYVLFIWGGTLAVHGYVPAFIAMWMPNVLATAVAIFLMTKVIRL